MKFTRSVKHHINMGNYEFVEVLASVDGDDEVNDLETVDEVLESLIQSDLRKTKKLADDDSYIHTWRNR